MSFHHKLIIMGNLKDLILKNRSYRRFYQNIEISEETLHELVDLARLSPSAKNAQSIKYIISNTPENNSKIFPSLGWAGYLKDWDGPEEGERPSAYLIMLNDSRISENYLCDDGIFAQSILLGAVEKELAGCIIASVSRAKLQQELNIPDYFKIIQVIALGKAKETIVLEDMKDDDFKYWRDNKCVHHVPKRSLNELIVKI